MSSSGYSAAQLRQRRAWAGISAPFSLTSSRARRLGRVWHLARLEQVAEASKGRFPQPLLMRAGPLPVALFPVYEAGGGPVTAPSEADETSAAYFAKTPVEYRGGGGLQRASRASSSCSASSTAKVRASTSMTTMSPSCRAAIGPPRTASGETCPTMRPCVAPEKRQIGRA